MISLIISFYKRLDFLELIFQSLDRQSFRDFEVIVAEDNDDPLTAEFIRVAGGKHSFPIRHVFQEDTGFRKTRILNSAVRISEGEKLVFIDGDCVPHSRFLSEYDRSIDEAHFCYGRRVFCSERHTEILLKSASIEKLNLLNAILYGGRSLGAGLYLPFKRNIDKQHRRILGCNWGIIRKNVLAVNGFDEDYERPGVGEDFDIDWRLKSSGFRVRSMKGKAIVYHLHHSTHFRDDTQFVENMLKEKKKAGNAFCLNGITRIQTV